MDVQLKELIEKIKNEGVESAEAQAKEIIGAAEKKAEGVIAQAEKDAESIREKAKAEAARTESGGREALKQAGRDLILSVEKNVETLFNRIIKESVTRAMDDSFMKESLLQILTNWKEDVADISVLLPEKHFAKLEEGLKAKLSEKISKGLEIRPVPELEAGFRISVKEGTAYYNFSNEEMTLLISQFLNPKMADLMREPVSGGTASGRTESEKAVSKER